MKEYQIGEKLQCEGKILQCVEISGPFCDGCFFAELCYNEDFIDMVTEKVGDCAESFRKDKKNVVFKPIEDKEQRSINSIYNLNDRFKLKFMKKYIMLFASIIALIVIGAQVFNHIHAWIGISIALCAFYPFYKFIKLLKDETEN